METLKIFLLSSIEDINKLIEAGELNLSESQLHNLQCANAALQSIDPNHLSNLSPHLLNLMHIANELLTQCNLIYMYAAITSECLHILSYIDTQCNP